MGKAFLLALLIIIIVAVVLYRSGADAHIPGMCYQGSNCSPAP